MSQRESYDDWKRRVSGWIGDRLGGMDIDDCPDIFDLSAAYHRGDTPRETANKFVQIQLADAGFGGDE